MIATLFWLLVTLVLFAHVGFPLIVVLLGAWLRRGHATGDVTPRVTVLIAAYNEAPGIRAKLLNTLGQDYPADRLDVVVVDDGSADGTAEAVRALGDPRVCLVELPAHGGKVAALNHGIRHCTGEILLLTDANAELEAQAVRRLVRPFADPRVGGVCGNQLNRTRAGALARGERLYWEYDKFLKRMESLTGSIVAADGSIYAIRREQFETVPDGVTDDLFVSTGVIGRGLRLVFEESARSVEDPPEQGRDHFHRRARITQQSLRSLQCRRSLLNPFRTGFYAFVLFGHKLLRRLAAPAMLLLLPLNLPLVAAAPVYRWALALQLLFYAAACAGWLLRDRRPVRLLSAATYFCLGNVATTVGIFRFLGGKKRMAWEPIRR